MTLSRTGPTDDPLPVVLEVDGSASPGADYDLYDVDGSMTFSATLTSGLDEDGAVTVGWRTVPGSATCGEQIPGSNPAKYYDTDFQASRGSLTFSSTGDLETFSVALDTGNHAKEGPESFTVELYNLKTGAVLETTTGADVGCTGTIDHVWAYLDTHPGYTLDVGNDGHPNSGGSPGRVIYFSKDPRNADANQVPMEVEIPDLGADASSYTWTLAMSAEGNVSYAPTVLSVANTTVYVCGTNNGGGTLQLKLTRSGGSLGTKAVTDNVHLTAAEVDISDDLPSADDRTDPGEYIPIDGQQSGSGTQGGVGNLQVAVPGSGLGDATLWYPWGNIIVQGINNGDTAHTGRFNVAAFHVCADNNIILCSIHNGQTEKDFVAVSAPSLVELTVTDPNDTSNSVTASGSAIPDLYVPEDQTTHGAGVDLSTLFAPSDAARDIFVRVVCTDDDKVIVAGENCTSLDETLLVDSDNARNFAITAWFDPSGSGQLGAGDETEKVNVHVVAPWKAQGNWTSGQASFVVANADNASLQQLAYDITGQTADALFLPDGPVTRGQSVDVTPLLGLLELRMRAAVVSAANSVNANRAKFDRDRDNIRAASTLTNENAIKSIFSPGAGPVVVRCDCITMVMLELTNGLISQLQPGEFAKLDPNDVNPVTLFPLMLWQGYLTRNGGAINSLEAGNWVAFWNPKDYITKHPGGDWSAEYAILVSGAGTVFPLFYGFDTGFKSYPQWLAILQDAYGPGKIPGYTGQSGFLDVPKVGQMIFNLRSSWKK